MTPSPPTARSDSPSPDGPGPEQDRPVGEGTPGPTSTPGWAVSAGPDAVPAASGAGAPSGVELLDAERANGQPVEGEPPQPPADPAWTRPALASLLLVTAIGYLWDLGRNGWGNTFYAAAVQSGTKSWSSFFFGSFDWGNYITVDKPPASLWIMELSGRIFGFNSWSMLVPEALLGVASVWLLFAAVRRAWGAPAGLLAGALLAITPAAALMFRFNNPDAVLTFLLVAAAYTLTRALERASIRWLLGTGALVGLAFLAKALQALLPLPGFALAYLVVAPAGLGRRIWHLLAAGAVMVASGLWWPLLVDALPASSRPYIGGSNTNSTMELILGYNGIGRITGAEGGPGGGNGGGGFGGGGFGGATGLTRMINEEFGGFIAWLLPAALLALVAAAWLLRRARRTDPRWGSVLVWGGWTLGTTAVLSYASGIVHTYYTVALAPGVAALAGMTLPALWRRRAQPPARVLLASICAASALTGYLLLGRATGWLPWLRWGVLVIGMVAAMGLLIPLTAGRRGRWIGTGAATAALAAGMAGPLAWTVATIGSTHTGSIPTAGPAGAAGIGFGARGPGGFARFRDRMAGADQFGANQAGAGQSGAVGQLPGNQLSGGQLSDGQLPGGASQGGQPAAGGQPFMNGQPPGGAGPGGAGPGGAERVDSALITLLRQGSTGYTWAAAASSSMTAGPLQLGADTPVMSLGGFNGGDPAITLARFKALVADRKVHYFVSGGGFDPGGLGAGGLGAGGSSRGQGSQGGQGGQGGQRGPGGQGETSSIASWVSSTFTAITVGNDTVYDLTKPVAGVG